MFSCKLRSYPVLSDLEDDHEHTEYYEYRDQDVYQPCVFTNNIFNATDLEHFSCDTCDRSFSFKRDYDTHMLEHRVCNLEGCSFTAHEKIIEKHIRMQHSTGLYDKIRNINTPEDIKRWIEERRKRYPTKENVNKSHEQQQKKTERGERINRSTNHFGRNKFSLRKIRENDKSQNVRKKRIKKSPKIKLCSSLINERRDWNGTIFPFRGTNELYKEVIQEEEHKYEDDEEWIPSSSTGVKLNNALGALMMTYMSDDEEYGEVLPNSITEQISQKECSVGVTGDNQQIEETTDITIHNSNEDMLPIEVKINKTRTRGSISLKNKELQDPNVKIIEVNEGKKKKVHNRLVKKTNDEFPYKFKKQKTSLLEKLLENEIRRERNILLQCVRFVVRKQLI